MRRLLGTAFLVVALTALPWLSETAHGCAAVWTDKDWPVAIASESASFAKPEISIGIPPTFGGTQRLPRLAGRKRALEYLLTGDPFSPQRAYEIGLVNQVVAKDRLVSASFELAHRIMRHSPLATARIISAVTRGLNTSIAEGLAIEGEQFARMAATEDTRKALDAWLAHRALVNAPS